MSFHDLRLEVRQPFGMSVATRRDVDVVALASGHEVRNARTLQALRLYTIPFGPRPIDEARAVVAFFEARGGPLHAFRFRDPLDHCTGNGAAGPSALDVTIGTADAQRISFQLITGAGRAIRRPDPATVAVAVDGDLADPETWSLDGANGIVSFVAPPPDGAIVSAGCEFDVPVRFNNQSLTIVRTLAQTAELDDLVLAEVFA